MEGVKLYQCKWGTCAMAFISHEEFITHFREEHEKKLLELREPEINYMKGREEYIWHCQWKGKYSLLPSSTNEQTCMKQFNRLDNFKVHIRSHTGDKPYVCGVPGCQKGFASASDRLKHEKRTHSEEKAYICDYGNCSKSYTDPSSLRKHFIRHHGYEEYERSKQSKPVLTEEDHLHNIESPVNNIYGWAEQLTGFLERPRTLQRAPTLSNSQNHIPRLLIPVPPEQCYYVSQSNPQIFKEECPSYVYQIHSIPPAIKEDYMDEEISRDFENYLSNMNSKRGANYRRH